MHVLSLALLATTLAAPDGLWHIELHARALAPGEPVRVVVRARAEAQDLGVTFLGQPVALEPATETGTFRGWAAVPLDARAGAGEVEMGWSRAGAPQRETRTVTIEKRTFPEQHLKVESRYVEPPPEVTRRIEAERTRLRGVWAGRAPAAVPLHPFLRPVPGKPTGIFGERRFFNGQPRAPHPGLDLKAATGTPVKAAGAGRVALAGDLYWTGGTVILDHGAGLFTVYAHLSKVEVAEGAVVEPGARVGLSGATGRVTGPHLHWGAKVGDVPVDPRALLDPTLFP
ncbi:MAG TPA: M23 family metallopeptidase [Candidatus Polarisedimenticolaceae bacterium]|nr:M23 family metallopeptidase [Candidatus Polarisedimenticolaceae bacterium]